ncbi:MAG: hypothetical protein QMD11_11430 [Smithella sp.]|nr:hypothetical protein [Smithella sp.]
MDSRQELAGMTHICHAGMGLSGIHVPLDFRCLLRGMPDVTE